MSIAIEPERSLGLDLIENLSNVFPSLLHDPKVKSLFQSDLDTLNQNLSFIIERIPFSTSNYPDALFKMQRYRDMQEQKIHDRIQGLRPIDFIDEVMKYNPSVGKAITESESICEALARIIRESNDRIQNLKKIYAYREYNLQEESSQEDGSKNRQEDETEERKFASETDTLSFFDLGELKRVHSDIGLDIEQVGIDEDSIEQKSKKVILYNSSGRYMFGYDKIENLIDPSLAEDEYSSDYGRDILKEIPVNQDANCNTYKFLSFT